MSTHIYWDIEAGLEDDHMQDPCMIGGPSVEVQIDESAFGKRKCNRGHPVATKCVIGGVKIVSDKKGRKHGGNMFFVVVPNHTMQTLNKVIARHVQPGTHVIADCWTGYNNVEALGMHHTKVNHLCFYVDPDTGMHTNTIKGKWNGVKGQMPCQAFRTPDVLQMSLGEVMWRTKYRHDL